MIHDIRIKFIKIALAALTVAMVCVTLVINTVHWISVRQEMYDTMSLISRNDGQYPLDSVKGDKPAKGGGRSSRESPYETRYFSVQESEDGTFSALDMTNIASVTEEEALLLAQRAVSSGHESGFLSNFLYLVKDKGTSRIVVFLDCETKLRAVGTLGLISAIACAAGILAAFLFVALVSKKAIGPMVKNAETQKQFITDAGHELKTPLSVISANMDILSLDLPKNEWVESTQKQVKHLRGLVNELVLLSRMDEEGGQVEMQQFDLSAAFADTAAPFATMAEFQGKELAVEVSSGIMYRGDEGMLRRLISILLDNAVKYAPEGDRIQAGLCSDGKRVTLSTANALTGPMDEATLSRLFDRFYRADPSRSRDGGKSGYGIGLSIARAVAEKHGGKMDARLEEGRICFTCTLPV